MPTGKALDTNEAAFLAALLESDPDAEHWTAHWGVQNLGGHGADAVACSYEGSYSVMKELIRRGLVDREPEDKRLNHDTGVSINDAGREALKARQG